FEKALKINPNDIKLLSNYAVALSIIGKYESAIEKFEKALKINPNDNKLLSNYAVALAGIGKYELAIEKIEKALKINPNDNKTLYLYSAVLEIIGKYDEAISKLEKIETNNIPKNQTNFIYLNLGRLCYRIKSESLGNKYFDLAIQNSEDEDAARIESAKNIFAVSGYTEDAIEKLEQITKESPHYSQARRLLSLKSFGEGFFKNFNVDSEDKIKDTESLARGIYHKIINEINILKSILYEITIDTENPFIKQIIEQVENILNEINLRRDKEKKKVQKIPQHDYQQLIKIISETAHDISDFVNNELFGIKTDIKLFQNNLDKDDLLRQKLTEIADQIESSEGILNDLKAAHEGIMIRYGTFKIKQLFETWQYNNRFRQAEIQLDIKNSEEEFYGDEQKIKGFLNELIENSVKHNPDKEDLKISISAENEFKTLAETNISISKKYLLIIFTDNGKGIPDNKKDWIYLPLTTSSEHGSGLGLFLIKKTIEKMNGEIEEDGVNSVRFKIRIPYGEKDE
ncbi:MAG: tetratricopeptide repeat protein, partial [Desulfobacteraceae bacterium]|nr:tetratricopeptide repeat protein [Desulfobacteraceae bacterium]